MVGGPSRRRWVLATAVAVCVAVAVGAYLLGRGTRTPAQIVAQAKAPRATVLTGRVRYVRPKTVLVFRATLQYDETESVSYAEPDSGVAVVSARSVQVGGVVDDGESIGAISGRPVFVLVGVVPAYATMAPGSSGVEVRELQAGLRAAGFSTGDDRSGVYGAGTAAGVLKLYKHYGYTPVTEKIRLHGSGAVRKARRYATVPLGEIQFVPRLPATVASVPSLGSKLASSTFVRLSSGQLTMSTETNKNTASLLRKGLLGYAISDLSGQKIRVRLTSVGRVTSSASGTPEAKLIFAPVVPSAAATLVGQNLAVHLRSGSSRSEWVVPVSALVTTAAGSSSVTVLVDGRERLVRVGVGAVTGGSQVIYPRKVKLHVGEQVVVGIGSK